MFASIMQSKDERSGAENRKALKTTDETIHMCWEKAMLTSVQI